MGYGSRCNRKFYAHPTEEESPSCCAQFCQHSLRPSPYRMVETPKYWFCRSTGVEYRNFRMTPQVGDSDPFLQVRTLRVREGGDSALGPTVPAHFPWPPWPPLARSSDTADSLAGDGCFGLLISSGDGFPCTVHTPLSTAWCLRAGRRTPTRQLARDSASVLICGLRGLGQPHPPSPRPEPGVGHCGSPGGGAVPSRQVPLGRSAPHLAVFGLWSKAAEPPGVGIGSGPQQGCLDFRAFSLEVFLSRGGKRRLEDDGCFAQGHTASEELS